MIYSILVDQGETLESTLARGKCVRLAGLWHDVRLVCTQKVGEMAMLAQRALMRAPATSLRSAAPIHRSQSRTFIYVSGTPPLKL
jgi:hypothetical protein